MSARDVREVVHVLAKLSEYVSSFQMIYTVKHFFLSVETKVSYDFVIMLIKHLWYKPDIHLLEGWYQCISSTGVLCI